MWKANCKKFGLVQNIFMAVPAILNVTYSAPIEEISFNKEDYAADFNWEQPCPVCQIGNESTPWTLWSIFRLYALS